MASMSAIDPVRIFISYKKDDEAGDRRGRALADELAKLVRDRSGPSAADVVVWYDRDLATGEEWDREIRRELARADIYVLVYSKAFFSKDGYIALKELPTIIARASETQVLPVVRTDFDIAADIPANFSRLRRFQAAAEGAPLDAMEPDDRSSAIEALADDVIAAAARTLAGRVTTSARPLVAELIARVAKIHSDQLAGIGTNPEDQLKFPVLRSIEQLAPTVSSRKLTLNTEDSHPSEDVGGVRLDIAVIDSTGYRVGHVELKSPSKGADPVSPTGTGGWTAHDREQWQKLRALPNLIYSNGYDWTLFRSGVRLASARLGESDGESLPDRDLRAFVELVTQFLQWSPQPPRTARALAKRIAPLARLLRDAVRGELERGLIGPADKLARMHRTWQEVLMPDASTEEFADSVAQTFTYGLLLARVEDEVALPLNADDVAQSLRSHGHRLLGSVLDLFADEAVRSRLEEPIGLIESSIAAVDPLRLASRKNTWLYFYEDFLAEYDPKLRKDAGVYYTPVEVVQAQVRLVDSVLKTRFGKTLGIASADVNVLDPAVGTGTYLLAIAEHTLDATQAVGMPEHDVKRQLRARLHGFEILIGAYSVAHLRLSQLLQDDDSPSSTEPGVHIYLSDTLTAPMAEHGAMDAPPLFVSEVFDNIVEERRRASVVKSARTPVQVVIGNPPYDRSKRSTEEGNIVLRGVPGASPIAPLIDVFRDPVIKAGKGQALKHNLDDPYIHFMRWAIWKACEQPGSAPGIVSLITNSSYLRSAPFMGVREHLRREFDEVWIIDLGGDNRGARPEPNVFNIQTPVCIIVALQRPTTDEGRSVSRRDRAKRPARVWYRRIQGTREEKLQMLDRAAELKREEQQWTEVKSSEWSARLVPDGTTEFWAWPSLAKIFPWQNSGAQYTRSWPIAPDAATLERRWNELYADGSPKPVMFKESRGKRATAGNVAGVVSRPKEGTDLVTGDILPPLDANGASVSRVGAVRYGFRSYDRMWCLPDTRVGDFLRTPLWRVQGDKQSYFATMTQTALGKGPALTVGIDVPDLHYFSGRGTKDVIPLWRDAGGIRPNLNRRLIADLEAKFEHPLDAEDVFSYAFALLGTSAYTIKFAEDLRESPPRLPITLDRELFKEVAEFGRRLLMSCTYGERFGDMNEFGQRVPRAATGSASVWRPTSKISYPRNFRYEPSQSKLYVGDGEISGVRPEVWNYEISKLQVVKSWLGYRMLDRKGKKTSPLDTIGPSEWTFDLELLQLLHLIEVLVDAEAEAASLLDRVVTGPLIQEADVPSPSKEEAAPPKEGGLLDQI